MSRSVTGRLGDAEFLVESDDLEFGRRQAVHEYPLRDDPYVEDMGRKRREHTISVSVMGADWQAKRDKLRAVIEKQGPHTLVHPDFGTVKVSVTAARMRQSMREFGKATFTLTFVQGGDAEPRYPSTVSDTSAAVADAASLVTTAAIEDFARTFDVTGMASAYVEALQGELGSVLSGIEKTVGAVTSDIADLIRAPYEMGAAIAGSVTQLAVLVAEPGQALQLYRAQFSAGESSQALPTNTAIRKQQARSQQALHNLVRRAAIAEAAKATAAMTFATSNEAATATNSLIAAIDVQMESGDVVSGAPIDDATYFRLADLRAALYADLRERMVQLPKLRTHTPSATLPALVIAHQLYGDASRAEEIVSRNRISHPGFVRGGTDLEILNV